MGDIPEEREAHARAYFVVDHDPRVLSWENAEPAVRDKYLAMADIRLVEDEPKPKVASRPELYYRVIDGMVPLEDVHKLLTTLSGRGIATAYFDSDCECRTWCRENVLAPLVNGHHENCPKGRNKK